MKTFKSSWKNIAAMLAVAATPAMASEAVDLLPFAYRGTAKPPRMTYTKSHPEFGRKPPIVTVDGQKCIPIPGGNAVYSGSKGPFAQYSAPGTLLLTLAGDISGEADKINMTVNYNKYKKGNGSAGREVKSFTVTPGKFIKTVEFTVVPDTAALQYIFGLNGNKGSNWNLTRMTIEYAADNVKLVKITPNMNLMPSRWKGVPQLDCFFNHQNINIAEVRTSVKLAYDDKNLYVGFIASEPEMHLLKADVKERDGGVWNDDCVELYFLDTEHDIVKQFIVNPINTQFDCERRQAQAGDPYKVKPWSGKWTSKVWKGKNKWEAAMCIPWTTIGLSGIPTQPMKINLARERYANKEKSHWNCYQGGFDEVNNYAVIDFQKNEIIRNRKVERVNYLPKRARKEFKKLLGTEPNNWSGWNWSSEFYLVYQQPSVKAKHTLESIIPHQKKMLQAYGEANIAGPGMPHVMMPRNTKLKLNDFLEFNKKYGTKFPYGSRLSDGAAKKAGAEPSVSITPGRVSVDPGHPASIQTALKHLDNIAAELEKRPALKPLVAFIHGIDEPTNAITYIYSKNRNPDQTAIIDKYDAIIKESTGFGKYGVYDAFGKPGKNAMFDRIAFWRWWNNNFANYVQSVSKRAAEKLPGYDFMLYNRNTCSGTDTIDVALCDGKHVVSCDPYPTSTKAYFGMGRALYHTGFSVKILRDLSPKAEVSIYAQAFNYNGGTPVRAELREWASQAIKNGADKLQWYSSSALSHNTEIYNEALEISRFVGKLPKIKRPTETKTAIFYSDYDRWALLDRPLHAAYTVYSILGEHNTNWFRFVSKNSWRMDGIKLLYIPRMRFTDPELTAKLKDFVINGGTAVILDPDFMSNNIDGSTVPERAEFIGTTLKKISNGDMKIFYNKKPMPVSKLAHIDLPENGTVYAFDFAKLPAGAKVLATYGNGKPAIIERAIGKGKVIFSGVMPFGTSNAAITPEGWKDFFADQAKKVGEKNNLDIWFFDLPEVKDKHFKLQPLK